MPVQAAITLTTGKVYNPRGKDSNGVASWKFPEDVNYGNGPSLLTESVSGPTKEGITRVRFKLDVIMLAGADSACACIGSELGRAIANIEVVLPSSFTAAQRADVRARIQALVGSAVFSTAVDNLEGSW